MKTFYLSIHIIMTVLFFSNPFIGLVWCILCSACLTTIADPSAMTGAFIFGTVALGVLMVLSGWMADTEEKPKVK